MGGSGFKEDVRAFARVDSGGADGRNGQAQTSYRGIQYDAKGNRWRARLHTDRTRHVGYFGSQEEAAKAWDQALLRYTNDAEALKKLNFPQESINKFHQMVYCANEWGDLEDFRGVTKASDGKFRAFVLHNRVNTSVGAFDTVEEAARAHDWHSIMKNGWGTLTNFPIHQYEEEHLRNGGVSPLDKRPLPKLPPSKGIPKGCVVTHGQMVPSYHLPHSNSFSVGNTTNSNNSPDGLGSMHQHVMGKTWSTPDLLDFAQSVVANQQTKIPSSLVANANSIQLQRARSLPDVEVNVLGRELLRSNSSTSDVDQSMLVGTRRNSKQETHGVYHHNLYENRNYEGVDRIGDVWKAKISLEIGPFGSEEEASLAYERVKLLSYGYAAYTASELETLLDRLRAAASNRPQPHIMEQDSCYYLKVKIRNSYFQLGPYGTRHEAAMAHDKYSLLLNGVQGSTQYPLVDSLMAEEDASSLLNALGLPCINQNPDVQTNKNISITMHQIPGNAFAQTTAAVSGSNQLQAAAETNLPQIQGANPLMRTPIDSSESLSQQLAAIENSIQSIQKKGQGKRAPDSQDVQLDSDGKKARSEQLSPRGASEYADAAMAAASDLGAQLGTASAIPRPNMVNSLHSDVDQDNNVPPPTVCPIPPFPKQ
eukprot:jgi/Picsp_1/318/NSC_00317-R1_ap2-like protein